MTSSDFPTKPEAVSRQRGGQWNSEKNDPMAFKDQWAAVNERAVKIEDD